MNNIFTNIITALFFVILLIIGISFIYKKKRGTSRLIDLIEYRSFGQKMAVAAMKINKDIYILGITPNDMKVIEKINEDVLGLSSKADVHQENISEKIKRLRQIKEEL
jgi:flagellar biogenesis protein FliO